MTELQGKRQGSAIKLNVLWEMILDFVFPSNIYCMCCDNLVDKTREYSLCNDCIQNIRWAGESTCDKCGKILNNTERRKLADMEGKDLEGAKFEGKDLCGDCRRGIHYFDRGFTCMLYGKKEREIIHKFKFNGRAYMGENLGKIMLDRISLEDLQLDMVMAVPAHKKTKAKRGYNQAEVMAKFVAKGLGVSYNNQVLIRTGYKAPMNKLDAKERVLNVGDAYELNRRIYKKAENGCKEKAFLQGKSILLIDDVYTTGSTVNTCSNLLKSAGADKVFVLTLAAGAG